VQAGNGGRARLGALIPIGAAVAVALAIVVGYAYLHAPRATRVRVGDVAPDFTLSPVDGSKPLRLSSLRGGPTLLVFFESKRDGNESYFESLQRLKRRFVEEGFNVLAVSLDTSPEAVRNFLIRVYVEFPIVSDPLAATVHTAYGTPRDPEAYLIDREGRVKAVFTERVDWNTVEFLNLLRAELKPSPRP
jgi:peroxiredoxin